MARPYFAWCPCCGPGGPCEFTDTFLGPDTRWNVTQEPGGSTVGFEVNETSEVMDASGDGSCTMEVEQPGAGEVIFVAAALAVETSGETGVTIRRVDSDDRIELVRTWGTANTWELRQGVTVLETIVDTHQPQCKLEIANPAGPTTDVNVYLYDAINSEWDLIHTESGVTWETPEVLNLGMVSRGTGGGFGEVTISPCPPHECPQTFLCGDISVPTTWSLDAAFAPPDSEANCGEGGTTGLNCNGLGGEHFLIQSALVYTFLNQVLNPPDPPSGPTWVHNDFGYPSACTWFSVIQSRDANLERAAQYCNTATLNTPVPTLASDRWPVEFWGCCDMGEPQPHSFTDPLEPDIHRGAMYPAWVVRVLSENVGTELDPDWEVWIEAIGGSFNPISGDAWGYRSARFDLNSVDFTSGPVSLSFIDDPGDPLYRGFSLYECTHPATITLTPNGSQAMTDAVNGCLDICDPPLDPTEMVVMNATIGGETVPVCMPATFNDTTLSWEWDGSYAFTAHPTLGAIGFDFHIACESPGEGLPREWTLTIDDGTYTDKTPVEFLSGDQWSDASAAEMLSNGAAFAAAFSQCTAPPFSECCPDEPSYCCIPIELPTQGIIEPLFPGSCSEPGCSVSADFLTLTTGPIIEGGSDISGSISGFNPSRPYYIGPVPIDGDGAFTGSRLLIYCNGSGVVPYLIDGTSSGHTATWVAGESWTCGGTSGTVEFTNPTELCCGGGAGTFKVEIG